MARAPLCVTGLGAVTAVGLSAVQTCSSVRAGISRFAQHAFHYPLIDPPHRDEPELLGCAPVALLDALARAPDRLLDLALAGLEEVILDARLVRGDLAEAGLFLATAPVVDGVPEWGLERHLVPELCRRAALEPFPVTKIVRQGPTGFFHLLRAARQAIAEGQCRSALVGGVDSFLDEDSVNHFDQTYRLKSARSRDGFVPGEAAAWLWLETAESAAGRGARLLGGLGPVALAREEQPFTGEGNSSGRGLTEALRKVLGADGAGPDWVVCDLNGESYRAYEWGLVLTRMGKELSGLQAVWHPADCFGDVRAAGPPLHAILACQAFRKGYAPGSRCLIFAGEDGGERGACIVSDETAERNRR